MPKAIFFVPGIGAQGGNIKDMMVNLNSDGLGAIFPISRGITYHKDLSLSEQDYCRILKEQATGFVLSFKTHFKTSV